MNALLEMAKLEAAAWRTRFPSWSSELRSTALLPSLEDQYVAGWFVLFFSVVAPLVQFWMLPRVALLAGVRTAAMAAKFSDAAAQVLFYLPMCAWELFVCVTSTWAMSMNFFEGHPNNGMSPSMQSIYMIQLGYYIYSLLALLLIPQPHRKDLVVMALHHVTTIGVVTLSYCTNNTRIGIVIFAIHDPADVFLNLAKVSNYLQRKKLCDGFFLLFAVCWFATRVALLPIVIYRCCQEIPARIANQYAYPGDLSSLACLAALFVMHVYWSVLIVRMAWRALAKKGVEKDIRSDDEEDEPVSAKAYSQNEPRAHENY